VYKTNNFNIKYRMARSNVKRLTLYKRLTSIYGIGSSTAYAICKHFELKPNVQISELSDQELFKVTNFATKKFLVESDLKKEVINDIARLASISCYRGLRHKVGLPLRGQRTSTNAKTQKRIGKRYQNRRN